MIIATWRVLDEDTNEMKSVSEDFFNNAHWEEEKFFHFNKHSGLPLWVVELGENGSFVREWTLELDRIDR
jgi:hypothetical protein